MQQWWGPKVQKKWCVLAVKPQKERFVEQQLVHSGFCIAVPRYVKYIRHARSVKRVRAPLFPGYIFIELDRDTSSWREVNWVSGAIGLILADGKPSALAIDFVDSFIANMDGDGVVKFAQTLEIGDRVQAIGGPFDRMKGRLIEMSDQDRVTVLFDSIDRKIETALPRAAVLATA